MSKQSLRNIRNKVWRKAEREYALADRDYRDAKDRRDRAKSVLTKHLERLAPAVGESVYAEGEVIKARLTLSAGRVTMDAKSRDRLFAEHPEIDRTQYEKHGTPYYSFSAELLPGAIEIIVVETEQEVA